MLDRITTQHNIVVPIVKGHDVGPVWGILCEAHLGLVWVVPGPQSHPQWACAGMFAGSSLTPMFKLRPSGVKVQPTKSRPTQKSVWTDRGVNISIFGKGKQSFCSLRSRFISSVKLALLTSMIHTRARQHC